MQNTSINVLYNFCTADDLKCLNEHMGGEVERLTIVINVGMDADGSVFVAGERPGRHWVLVSSDLSSNPTVLYCDSLGWNSPTNLLESLSTFTAVLGIVKMHVPTTTGHGHHHPADCKNYPLQTCSNMCGVFISNFIVVAVVFISNFIGKVSQESFNLLVHQWQNKHTSLLKCLIQMDHS